MKPLWREVGTHYKNGQLLSIASQSGFTCLLTRDILFGQSAIQAMNEYPKIAIVLVTIPQNKGKKVCRGISKILEKISYQPTTTKSYSMAIPKSDYKKTLVMVRDLYKLPQNPLKLCKFYNAPCFLLSQKI